MNLQKNIQQVRARIPAHVQLVVVSKTMPVALLQEAFDCGERVFGENKVQEICFKQPRLPADIQWHLIGHLQTNKVKLVVPIVAMIESVDSLNLLQEIDKQAIKSNKIQHCLLQFHIAEEETKFGLTLQEAMDLLDELQRTPLKNCTICGVMGIATFTNETHQIIKEFRYLKQVFNTLKMLYFTDNQTFKEISMGMSGDYELAISEGATIVRVGTKIFGERRYTASF